MIQPVEQPRLPPEAAVRTRADGTGAGNAPVDWDAGGVPTSGTWTAPDGRTFELEPLGSGGMAHAYKVKSIDGKPPDVPTALKIGKPNDPRFETAAARARNAGSYEAMMSDIAHGNDLLAEGELPHLRIREAVLAGEHSYVLQDLAGPDDVLFSVSREQLEALKAGEVPEGARLPTAEENAAIAELMDRMSNQGLAWADGHLENLYVRHGPDGPVAGVLDSDMIFEPGQVPSERLADVIFKQVAPVRDTRGVYAGGQFQKGIFPRMEMTFRSAREFNEMMLQLKHWVRSTPEGVMPMVGSPDVFRGAGFDLTVAAPGG